MECFRGPHKLHSRNAFAGRTKRIRGPHAARGPYVVQACSSLFTLAQSRDIRDTATHTFYTEKQLKIKQRAALLIGLS